MRRLALAAILLWTPAIAGQPYVTAASLGQSMREQVLKCWKLNPGARRRMFVVDFRLNKDGTLAGTPSLHPGSPPLPPKAVTAGGEPRQQFDVVLYNLTEKGQLTDGKTLSDSWDPDLRPFEKAAATQK